MYSTELDDEEITTLFRPRSNSLRQLILRMTTFVSLTVEASENAKGSRKVCAKLLEEDHPIDETRVAMSPTFMCLTISTYEPIE